MIRLLLKRIEADELRKRVQASGQFLEDVKAIRTLANVDEIKICKDVVKCIEVSPQHMRLFWAGAVSIVNLLLETEEALKKEAKAMQQLNVFVDSENHPQHLAMPNEQAQHLGAEKQNDKWRPVCNKKPDTLTVTNATPEVQLSCAECQEQLKMWKEVHSGSDD